MQLDSAEGERQAHGLPRRPRRLAVRIGQRAQPGVERRVQQTPGARRSTRPPRCSAQRNLGEELLAAPPSARRPWKTGPYSKPRSASVVIETVEIDRPRVPRRPGSIRRRLVRPPAARSRRQRPHARAPAPRWRDDVHSASASRRPRAALRARVDARPARPRLVGSPTASCSCTGRPRQSTSGASSMSSRTAPHPSSRAGVQRQLEERRARQQHAAHHRVIGKPRMRLEREPAREQPPPSSASATIAPSSGCSAAHWPTAATLAHARATASSQ